MHRIQKKKTELIKTALVNKGFTRLPTKVIDVKRQNELLVKFVDSRIGEFVDVIDVEELKSHLEELKRLQSDFNPLEEGFISMLPLSLHLTFWENT